MWCFSKSADCAVAAAAPLPSSVCRAVLGQAHGCRTWRVRSVRGPLPSRPLCAGGTEGETGCPAVPQPERALLSPGDPPGCAAASSGPCCPTAGGAESSPVALLSPEGPVPPRGRGLAALPGRVPLGGARARHRQPQTGAPSSAAPRRECGRCPRVRRGRRGPSGRSQSSKEGRAGGTRCGAARGVPPHHRQKKRNPGRCAPAVLGKDGAPGTVVSAGSAVPPREQGGVCCP